MDPKKTIRAWRDDDYFTSLTEEERRELTPSPAGVMELPDEDTDAIAGATHWALCTSIPCGAISYKLNCAQSWLDGSCEVMTFGCCEPTDDTGDTF